jgi:hypothetical protein
VLLAMDREARQRYMSEHLNVRNHSDPSDIVYSDENDHNPLVPEDCPGCFGTGKRCRLVAHGAGTAYGLERCTACAGAKTTGNLVRKYKNDSPALEAGVNEFGWTKCPGCGVNFKTTSSVSWSGLRHKTCGQKILLSIADPL